MAHTTSPCNKEDNEKLAPNEPDVLQKHIMFFDRNQDGIIYPWETYKGFRSMGVGFLMSLACTIFIHIVFSQRTRPGKFPSPLFPIEVKNITRSMHGSDSRAYDTDGRFNSEKFEEIFTKHARSHPDALTSDEINEMLKANRDAKDFRGWIASWAEWRALYAIAKDKNGLLHRDAIRGVYDGSLYERMEKEEKIR